MGRAGLLLGALVALVLGTAAGAEQIHEFAIEIHLDPDGSFAVEERIVYDFGAELRHGIDRKIPVRYRRPWGGRYHISLDVEEVTDESGADLRHAVSRRGDSLRIRIGDPDRTIRGQHEYRIRYRVRRGLLHFEDHDELYWNATGTEWRVAIGRASAEVYLPPGLAASAVRLACFAGPRGSLASECLAARRHESVGFAVERRLDPGEGLTIVVGLPKGVVREPSALDRLLARVGQSGALWLLLPLGAMTGMLQLWRTRGRDAAGSASIPVRYAPPAGLTPAEVGTLADEKADLADVTATILDLAVRGYLWIEEVEATRFLFFSDKDYRLRRKRSADETLKEHERLLFRALFEDGGEVLVSSLKNEFYTHLPRIKKALYGLLSGGGGCFPASPERVRRHWAVGGGLVAAAGFAGAALEWIGLVAAAAFVLTGAVVAAFSRIMPRRTRKGRRLYEEVLGFEEFVRRVDADRLERMGGRTAENFEKVLPYAIVLGVGDEWADAFADLYTQPPDWYRGDYASGFYPRHFVSDVGRSLATIGNTLASAPRSGSGSSGFGGGFSGGGFGGGGGGSW